ncbi:MAG: hypothetical protein PHS13_08265 [Firmicutes bacterium]|nr:hypothetical protein [Bacillota bacterium]MDD3298967.1 hypothetical protein [Bacillota bacterium]MDD3851594.1 hypothetical protein [Bacillota bacterium]MDD4708000.1 hypothetical protein [Bacillota bacterium]
MSIKTAQMPCSTDIDYSQVTEDPILPFIFQLNLADSILDPDPGENQRFCYNVMGVGEDTDEFADLSHFVLGICDEIPEDQIVNITVNGEPQVINGDVELRTPQNPDPQTGCAGLKFDFEVNKAGGQLTFCFELTQIYPIGPNPVCLFGGGETAEGLSICGPECQQVETCEGVGYQPLSVCVPVTVSPFAIEGTSTTFCCGDPVVTPGPAVCEGVEDGICEFTMTQDLCVRVPVTFGATSLVGSTFVQCGDATDEDVCTGCGDVNSQ